MVDYFDNEDDFNFDELESALLREDYNSYSTSKSSYASGAEFGKKVNFSNKVENEIVRSERKSEKRDNYYGRDDRATSEQVLDPRTRLILFKLLNTGFLTEIDGKYLFIK
jgi:hypothetical protein